MSFLRYGLILLSILLVIPGLSVASNQYSYISAADLESRLTADQPTNLIDIQVEEEFSRHHIRGAIPTYAYPVKSNTDRAKLDATIDQLNSNSQPVVIVCPRGGGGAKRTYDYLLQKGISGERLLILEKGQTGWSHTSLTESK